MCSLVRTKLLLFGDLLAQTNSTPDDGTAASETVQLEMNIRVSIEECKNNQVWRGGMDLR